MRSGIKKAAFLFMFVFLTGCGREENTLENREDALAKIAGNGEVSAEVENKESVFTEQKDEEDSLKEAKAEYPLIVTPSEAEWIDFVILSEKIYCIFDGEAYGFITESGEEIAPCIYDEAYPFSEGLACVCKDGKYGYINSDGEMSIPFAYDRATPFVEGLAYFSIGDTYGFMDQTGTPVLSFECDSISSFQEGLAFFSIDGRYGYIDQHGQIAIGPVFDDAGYFQEGLAKVMKDGRYGIINRNGDVVLAAEYDSITIDGSFIITQAKGKYACFDRTGKTLLKQSEYIFVSPNGEQACFKKEGKWGLIDEKGDILIEPLYDWLLQTPEQDLLIMQEGDLYGVVNLQGEIRIPAAYDQISYDSYADSTEGGMFLLTDTDGNLESMDVTDFSEIIPCDYDSIDWLSKDRAIVSLDGLWGIIDREGNLIEPITYDVIRVFTNGAVWMKKDGKNWFYNSSGEEVKDIDYYDNIFQRGNCYQTERDGKYGFLNEQGEKVVPPIYDNISNYNVYGYPFNTYVSTDYNSNVWDSIIKTGEPVEADISGVLLQNEITPVIGLYQEFAQNGAISVEDGAPGGYTVSQENLRGYKKTYKLYDLDHSGKPILYFKAEPYIRANFPESYSGFYAIQNDQLVELFTGYECGGSLRGDYVCLWYDRETSQVLPGTEGCWGGFGGSAYYGAVYDRKDGEMTSIASFGAMTQPIGNYSDEELERAELVYDQEDRPYTKEELEQAENGEIVQIYSVNDAQTTIEEYQKMRARYQILLGVE